jgi:hypothetical protein
MSSFMDDYEGIIVVIIDPIVRRVQVPNRAPPVPRFHGRCDVSGSMELPQTVLVPKLLMVVQVDLGEAGGSLLR